jgi:hypothetical protein
VLRSYTTFGYGIGKVDNKVAFCGVSKVFVTLWRRDYGKLLRNINRERENCNSVGNVQDRKLEKILEGKRMKHGDKTSRALSSDLISNKDTTRIQEPWLTLARIAWIVIVVPTFVVFVANIPAYFTALHRLHASDQHVFRGQLNLVDVHTLQSWGLSLDFYATCMVLASLLFQFSYAAVGVILFLRRSNDRVALLASFALLMVPFGYDYLTLQALAPVWLWLIPTLSVLGNVSIMICAYVFPDGRFAPHWIRWLTLFMICFWVVNAILLTWPISPLFFDLIFLGLIASTIIVQVYRYRTMSTSRQRQQTKWVVYGISIAALGNLGTRLLFTFVLLPRSHNTLLLLALEVLLVTCSMLVIPPTLGIAILRSHLWDIDIIINRTLVYAVLTAILALVYFGTILGLQSLVNAFTGQLSLRSQSPLVIVASTLAIAALFQPLRRRIQAIIDRRFYRSKYDAARTLAVFSATLRDEMNIDELREALLAVVQETMQPSHVSLWLKTTDGDEQNRRDSMKATEGR